VWDKGDFSCFFSFGPAAVRKNHWGFPAGGQKGRGSGGRNFCPPAFCRRQNGVGKRFRNSCVSRKAKQKNFRLKKIGGRQLKNVKKIFLFCSPKGERKRWAGQSAKSSGFCSKKVLTSSNKHHHIELAASPSPSARASAGTFARKSKGFLKSIESFCWLIWRFKPIFFFRRWRKARRDFIKLSV